MLLAADIGGTKTHLALFEAKNGSLEKCKDRVYASADFANAEAIFDDFLHAADLSGLQAGCVGVAGPVRGGACVTTNLPWRLDVRRLSAAVSNKPFHLINDLAATAYGLLHLPPQDFAVLQAGSEPWGEGNIAIIAAGTGLGEACLFWDGSAFQPLATEGGHVDYAAVTPLEAELLQYLSAKYGGHVSYERVLSGPGLTDMYDFYRDVHHLEEPREFRAQSVQGDRAAAIADLALKGESPLCEAALDLFATAYGRAAGNLALKFLAYGGVALAGGIAPKILPALQRPIFINAFLDKGRFADLLRTLEIRVVLNEEAGLLGAAYFARERLKDQN